MHDLKIKQKDFKSLKKCTTINAYLLDIKFYSNIEFGKNQVWIFNQHFQIQY